MNIPFFAYPPSDLAHARRRYRYLYSSVPELHEMVDYLVSLTTFPERIFYVYGDGVRNIAHDFWLYGWVVFENDIPHLCNPDFLRVSTVYDRNTHQRMYEQIFSAFPGQEMEEITSRVTLLARRTSPQETLGHSILEPFLQSPGAAVNDALAMAYLGHPELYTVPEVGSTGQEIQTTSRYDILTGSL